MRAGCGCGKPKRERRAPKEVNEVNRNPLRRLKDGMVKIDVSLVGAKVLKHFPDFGWFDGEIKSVDAVLGYYVVYQDGDSEDLSLSDARRAQKHFKEHQASRLPSSSTMESARGRGKRSSPERPAPASARPLRAAAQSVLTQHLPVKKPPTLPVGAIQPDAKRRRQDIPHVISVDQNSDTTAGITPVADVEKLPGSPAAELTKPPAEPEQQGAAATSHPVPLPPATSQCMAQGAAQRMASGSQKSEYELERDRRIAENKKRMAELGLPGLASLLSLPKVGKSAASKVASSRMRAPAEPRERRTSERQKGGTVDYRELDDRVHNFDGEARSLKERPHSSNVRHWQSADVDAANEARWNMPLLFDEAGKSLPHRRSCHICTQCVASWRGDFDPPLGCSTCQLIWCTRCLGNIFTDLTPECINTFIQNANLTGWSCFMCQGTCACLDPRWKGLKNKIDRHKKAGWVGVTGNHDPSCSRPEVKAVAEDAKLHAAAQ
ncbi:hypothetical protein CYMTET_36543, partial [Cymbomonas tetramitiformis]